MCVCVCVCARVCVRVRACLYVRVTHHCDVASGRLITCPDSNHVMKLCMVGSEGP